MNAITTMANTDLAATEEEAVKAVLLTKHTLENIVAVERTIMEYPQVECPIFHRFGPGLYIREIHMPAGAFVIGNYQKFEHLNVMLKGRVVVVNDDGSHSEIVAPTVFVGRPGRKVGYVKEDVVWQNIYATDETDIAKLEEMFVIKSENWDAYLAEREKERPWYDDDRADYFRLLEEAGIPHEVARAESENESDMIPFPYGSYKVTITDSMIEGKGLFATANIDAGEVIAPARIFDKRTPAGRFTNHSADPNAEFVVSGSNLLLIALRPIHGNAGGAFGEEITIDYRKAIDIRRKLCHLQS